MAKEMHTLDECSKGVKKKSKEIKKRERKRLGIKKQIRQKKYPVSDILESDKFHKSLSKDLQK